MNIKNLFNLLCEGAKFTKEFSINVGIARIVRDLPFIKWENRRSFYENRLVNYLKNQYSDILLKYKDRPIYEENNKTASDYVWVMWWQGKENMPLIAAKCYEKLLENAGDRKVVLITQENIKQYISIPENITKKVSSGVITLTHFSDIIRSMLFMQYGGLWIDATVYTTAPLGEELNGDFYTLACNGIFPEFLSRGRWLPSFLYVSKPNNMLFDCLFELFCSYWEKHNLLLDYLLVDFFIYCIGEELPLINKMINSVPEEPLFYSLNPLLSEPFDKSKWDNITTSCKYHKLTYKLKTTELDGSFYNYILES